MKFFGGSKKPNLKKPYEDESPDDRDDFPHPHTEPSSPAKSPTKSPTKSPSKRSSRPASYVEPKPSRSSSSRLSRHSTDPGHSSSRRSKVDPNTHPLNLPPEERKRLSALATSAMNGRNSSSMDIDREPVNGTSTPPPQNAQANFSVPIPNGTGKRDGAPTPPPHKSNPSSPTPTPLEDAESYKAAGNRFFKERNYTKAIEQYSKGMHCCICLAISSC